MMPPPRYRPKNDAVPISLRGISRVSTRLTHEATAGATKYNPKQLIKMCDPLEWEKHAVKSVCLNVSDAHSRLRRLTSDRKEHWLRSGQSSPTSIGKGSDL
jgi:hypothetical protein